MKRPLFPLISLMVILCVSLRARAGFYQFTLTGHVTQSTHADVSVGDPFTIRYVADSFDRDPSPTVGNYMATPAIVEYPNVTITSIGFNPNVNVYVPPSESAVVEYFHIAGLETFSQIRFVLPPGVLESDALPLAFPPGTVGFFGEHRGLTGGYDIRGEVTSYESIEVPEASLLLPLLLPVLVSRALRRRGGHA